LCVGFKVVGRFDEINAGQFCKLDTHAMTKFGMRVDSGTNGGASHGQFIDGSRSLLGAHYTQFQLTGKTTEFLSQSERSRVCQVCSTNFDNLIPLFCFLGQAGSKLFKTRDQVVVDAGSDCNMNGSGKRVIRTLTHITWSFGWTDFSGANRS